MNSKRDHLKGAKDYYDVVVVGSGLGGLTGANCLAKQGHSVLLLENHYQFGGLATWFKRAGGHIFDISLHGFPVGMIKSCRRYWTKEIADSIVQLKNIRFVNPQYDLRTTFDRMDFTNILHMIPFKIARERVEEFYDHLRKMDYFAQDGRTIGDLLEEFFPGRDDVKTAPPGTNLLRQWLILYGSRHCLRDCFHQFYAQGDLHLQRRHRLLDS